MITDTITQRVAGAAAQRLGISEGTARTAVQLAVPVIMAALARNASQPQGAQDLHQALANDMASRSFWRNNKRSPRSLG